MYLRHTIRRKDGKVHRYWRLVRSVRVGRRVIKQTVAQLGELDERGRIEARALARRLIGAPEEAPLFNDGRGQLTAPVRLKGVRVERSRQFGEVYLALALWRGVGLEELCKQLLPTGQERVAWAKMAAVLVTARFCEPSSELHIAEDWYRRTALGDLLQLGDEEVNKDRLYRALDRLLAHKAAVETHLPPAVAAWLVCFCRGMAQPYERVVIFDRRGPSSACHARRRARVTSKNFYRGKTAATRG